MGGTDHAPRILVADDDPEFGYILGRWLELRGYACVRTRDAAGAVLALQEGGIDLVISDIDMPGNRGLALVKHIAVAGGPPVILITGKPSFETAVDAVGSRAAAYLVKPVDNEELARRIEAVLAEDAVKRAHAVADQRWREALATLAACEARLQAGESEGPVREELLALLRRYSAPPPSPDSTRLGALEEALRETIAVLEDTRKAFKSRQLGELRRRLQQLVPPASRL